MSTGREKSSWNFHPQTRFPFANHRRGTNVLPRLQGRDYGTATRLGRGVSAGSLRADVLLQLLVGVLQPANRSHLESRELPRVAARRRLFRDAVSIDVDCGPGHVVFPAAGLSACLLSLVSRGKAEGSSLPVGHHPPLGQLPGSRLRLEDDSRQRWRSQHAAAVRAPDQASARVPALQPVRRGADPDAHLHAIRHPAHLCVARAYPAPPGRSLARPGSVAAGDLLAGDLAAVHSRSAGRRDFCLRAQPGRLSGAAAAGWTERHHDFQHRRQPVRRRLQLAAGRGHFLLHAAAGGRPAFPLGEAGKKVEFPMRRERTGWLSGHAVAVFAFLYLPIVTLIVYSFNGQGVGGFPPRNLTLDWYRALFADDAIWDSVFNSLRVALAAVAIALAFGIPAALSLDRVNFPGKAIFRRLVLLPLILPGIITGLSLLMLFREAQMKLSLWTVMLGHGTALISVATTEVFAGLQKLDRAQEEASLDLGANYWQTFWRVTLPNLRLSILGAALLIFTLSMDEIAVSFFLIGRDNTLPLEIWGRLRRGITPEINAISTVIFVFSLIAIVTWYRLRAGGEGQPEIAGELLE